MEYGLNVTDLTGLSVISASPITFPMVYVPPEIGAKSKDRLGGINGTALLVTVAKPLLALSV
jgi:hypothetical protein